MSHARWKPRRTSMNESPRHLDMDSRASSQYQFVAFFRCALLPLGPACHACSIQGNDSSFTSLSDFPVLHLPLASASMRVQLLSQLPFILIWLLFGVSHVRFVIRTSLLLWQSAAVWLLIVWKSWSMIIVQRDLLMWFRLGIQCDVLSLL